MNRMMAVAAAVFAVSAPAQASTVLDFNEFASEGPDPRYIQEASFDYQGFRFTGAYGVAPNFVSFARTDVRNADPGQATLAHRWDNFPLVITRVDGSAFDLISLDVADLFNAGAAHTNSVQFTYADGRATDGLSFTTDNEVGLETIVFDKAGLSSFSIAANSMQWLQLDNLTIGEAPIGAVPEPATWGMLILGFFGGGAALRAHRRRYAPA